MKPGTRVLTQELAPHSGVVLDRPSGFGPDWVWVDWEHIGECEEYVPDVTVAP